MKRRILHSSHSSHSDCDVVAIPSDFLSLSSFSAFSPSPFVSSFQTQSIEALPSIASVKDNVMIVKIRGELSLGRSSVFGGASTSYSDLQKAFRIAADREDIDALVLDIDSVGGSVRGIYETIDEIRQVKQQKPVIALTQGNMLSAAYWLGSQADYVVASESASIGSIGVLAMHQDFSEFFKRLGVKVTLVKSGDKKAKASPFYPLDDETRSEMLEKVQKIHSRFIADVESARKNSAYRKIWANGDVFDAIEAQRIGLIDTVVKPKDFERFLAHSVKMLER